MVPEQLRSELLAKVEIARQGCDTVMLDQSSVGRLSRMDAMQGQSMELETRRRREIYLRSIASALARIESGEYGRCLECDRDINIKRIELDPTLALCIHCANEREMS